MSLGTRVIDFHVHAFPNPLDRVAPLVAMSPLGPYLSPFLSKDRLESLRKQARAWMGPISDSLHHAQVQMRHLPEGARKGLDPVGALAAVPRLLVESSPEDLLEAMSASEISQALVVAHPPYASNEFVLETCAASERKLLAVVNVPGGTTNPGEKLKEYVAAGARALKIHAAADGEGPDSPRYKALLLAATDLGIPVILHTGLFYNAVLFKNPERGNPAPFAPWFEAYPSTAFVLAHMNLHHPQVAMDLAEAHSNVYLDTSWQPAEVIGEAVRRLGSERIVFSSGWPLVGDNLSVGLRRIRECVEAGTLTEADASRVLSENALRLLKEPAHAP